MCSNQTQSWMANLNDHFTVFCGVMSIIPNALVLYIALRYVDFHVKLNQIYVINMTVSDLLYGLAYMSTKHIVDCFPDWICACYYILVWSCQIGAVFYLLFLNIDKFISLSLPLHYHMYVTERRVHCLWITFWPILLAYSTFTYFGPFLIPSKDPNIFCKIGVHPIYYAWMIIICYIVPLTISASISVYIYVLAHKKTRWSPQSSEMHKGDRKRARKQKYLKRVFFVFSSTLWSTITILPYRLAYCIYTFACVGYPPSTNFNDSLFKSNSTTFTNENEIETFSSTLSSLTTFASVTMTNATIDQSEDGMCNNEKISILIYILFCLLPLGSVGNPIITIVTQRFYRSRAAQIWKSCMKTLHAPAFLVSSKCCHTRQSNGIDIDTTITSENMKTIGSVKRPGLNGEKESGVGVPLLLVTCRQSSGNDVVVEALCSNRAFQVL